MFFRDESGSVAALHDVCPHRFAPLSRGKVEGGIISCGYHGLAFNASGKCVNNLHGPTPKVGTRAYPAVERHEAIWVWPGNPELSDPAKIRDLSFIDDTPETAKFRGYMPTKANFQLLSDNILDLSHANSLHLESLGGIQPGFKMKVAELDDGVEVTWTAENVEPNGLTRAAMSENSLVDQYLHCSWRPAGLLILDGGAKMPGSDEFLEMTRALHSMTPETETTSHYFFAVTRITDLDNTDVTEAVRELTYQAFYNEDKPMIEAQQERMGNAEFWSLRPALLAIDNGAVRARRKLDKIIEAEQAGRLEAAETD